MFDKEYFGRKSVARNPIIFDIFNRLDLVEKVGTGIKRIMSAVEERGLTVEFEINGFFTIIFQRPPLLYQASTQQVPSKHPASTQHVYEILSFCEIPKKRDEIQEHLSLKDREYFRSSVLNPLLEEGLLEPLIPGKPRSPRQKYIITEKGKQLLNKQKT